MKTVEFPVVLPTLNEEGSIEQLIGRLRALGDFPIWVVDGFSTDRTVALAESLNVIVLSRKDYGIGYGCAIMTAFDYALEKGFEYVLLLDCDMSYHPEDLPLLYNQEGKPDLVLGCREMASISFFRRFGNRVHSAVASLLFTQKVSDVNTGMRLIRVASFSSYVSERGMGMMPQISGIAMRRGFRVREKKIKYSERVGESKVRFTDAFVILRCIIRERFKSL